MKKKEIGLSYNWRPDFRDLEDLPELRAVRTQFFLPTLFLVIAGVTIVFSVLREVHVKNIQQNIESLKVEIASYQEKHDAKVELNSGFMNTTRTLDEIVQFRSGRLLGSDFLLAVSSRLLEGMYLSRIEYIEGRASIEGNLKVSAEEASRLVDKFMVSLEEADVLQGLLDDYKLTSLERSAGGAHFNFRIEVTNSEAEEKK
ncbi:hypothetical protein [Pelagicoccus albus]|nr:hypothetical protein [Pelagicoccus albus]